MLTKDHIDSLPDDPVDALVAIADLFFAHLQAVESDRAGLSNIEALHCAEEVKAAIEGLETEGFYPRLFERQPPSPEAEIFSAWFADFRSSVAYYRTNAMMKRRKSATSVALGPSHRARIHALLNGIREIVPKLKVTPAKHERIFDLISKLENEVDRPRTRMESLLQLILQVSRVGKQVGEDAKPLIEGVERITDALSGAKEEEEAASTPRLPGPKETPKLPGPKEPGRPRSRADGLDDDIPF